MPAFATHTSPVGLNAMPQALISFVSTVAPLYGSVLALKSLTRLVATKPGPAPPAAGSPPPPQAIWTAALRLMASHFSLTQDRSIVLMRLGAVEAGLGFGYSLFMGQTSVRLVIRWTAGDGTMRADQTSHGLKWLYRSPRKIPCALDPSTTGGMRRRNERVASSAHEMEAIARVSRPVIGSIGG